RRELGAQALLAGAEPLAVARERRMRHTARDRCCTAGEQHQPRLAAVVAVHGAMPAAGARPQRVSGLGGPAGAPEAQLVEPVHLDLRDIGLAAARGRHRACVAAHLGAERAVVELSRDRLRRERFTRWHCVDYTRTRPVCPRAALITFRASAQLRPTTR